MATVSLPPSIYLSLPTDMVWLEQGQWTCDDFGLEILTEVIFGA